MMSDMYARQTQGFACKGVLVVLAGLSQHIWGNVMMSDMYARQTQGFACKGVLVVLAGLSQHTWGTNAYIVAATRAGGLRSQNTCMRRAGT